MQDLIAGMDREIASARQKAIDLRARMIYLETLQSKAAPDPTLPEQLAHLTRSFERAKKALSAMEAKKKDLVERMSQALLNPVLGLTDLDELSTCIPLPAFRKPHQRVNTPQQETVDADFEALKIKFNQL